MKIYIDGSELEFTNAVINIETSSEPTPEPEPTPQPEPEPINSNITEHFNIEYLGAFRVATSKGGSNSNYAVGVLAYNEDRDSLFLAGHDHHDAIAEFKIPNELGLSDKVKDLPNAECLQGYVKAIDDDENDRITGMLCYKNSLIVNSEIWYDGSGNNADNHRVFKDSSNLANSEVSEMLQLTCKAYGAGYMSKIPDSVKSDFNANYLTGWASNSSITSRYSQGPSLYTFNPDDSLNVDEEVTRKINTNPFIYYPLAEGKELVNYGAEYSKNPSPLWGSEAQVRYSFIVPNSKLFVCVGSHAGLQGGVGYKITQDNGNKCAGGCPYFHDDKYNYFWIYNTDDIVNASQPYEPKPFTCGRWSHPFDGGHKHKVIGATFDDKNNRLFICLDKAGQVGRYDRPPLIIVYKVGAR